MRKEIAKYSLVFLTVCIIADCRKSYAPPEINTNHLYLTVDGLINMTPGSISSIKLTRSQKLSDTIPSIPELGAAVNIMNAAGIGYPLTDTGSNGIYVSAVLTLDPAQQYVLSVTTKDGNQYASDPVTPKQTPPIDSVYWTVGTDGATGEQAVNIYLNTHDPSNNTRLYRWDFTETWEHESLYKSPYLVRNKKIVLVNVATEHNWSCWSSAASTNILLGSSAALSTDIIFREPIARIYQNDPRMDTRYSILVRQYAIDASTYDYWALVQKQSETLGGLFDTQPAQLTGNIHNRKVPAEPVYGFVSASTVQEKRIFVSNQELPGWKSIPTQQCNQLAFFVDTPTQDSNTYYETDPNFTIYGFGSVQSNLPGGKPQKGPFQFLMTLACLDCTFQGGSTIKPPFWQ
jgi:Domain of unknown function (DUF4249)